LKNAKEEVRGLNWRVIFLAILLLSAGVVTIGVTSLNLANLTSSRGSLSKVYLDESTPLQPIDADGPGG